ncbi:something about silencing protein 10-like [Lytechinus variegatus]|uniref:something about silencing protein 10-like n=1 Tax=Lytechinus variegatus TaxID=7654 RepID=UPI001BB1D7FA|nr:something about silencing protein 10-like [Lytechinus variegatus]
MGRRRKGGHRKKAEESDYDSDDPRAYAKEKEPDPSSRDYIYDEVDEFHANKEKISLDVGTALGPADSSDNEEEEVLGWDDEDDEEDTILKERLQRFRRQEKMDEMASDLEDEEDDDEGDGNTDEISSKAWGKRKQNYYDTDYVDDDLPGLDQLEETANQEAEEKEALAIQNRMAEALQDDDFGLDIFKSSEKQVEKATTDDLESEEKVTKDLSKLSKREKLELLKKESPEFLQLVADFKVKMRELIDRLQPLVGLIKDGVIQEGSEGAQYVHTKYQLYLSYCMNISFYMILKAKHVPVSNHPVIGRILAFGKLISELQPVDEKLAEEIESLLSKTDDVEEETKQTRLEREEELIVAPKIDKKRKKRRKQEDTTIEAESTSTKRKKTLPSLSEEELKALEYYKKIENKQREKKKQELPSIGDLDEEGEEDEEEDGDEKRAITYQISKNKGLTAYRRKELRNPRVKNRMKFRKAKIRRKGQVREARTELQRYSGEASGIRAGVIKSVKIR